MAAGDTRQGFEEDFGQREQGAGYSRGTTPRARPYATAVMAILKEESRRRKADVGLISIGSLPSCGRSARSAPLIIACKESVSLASSPKRRKRAPGWRSAARSTRQQQSRARHPAHRVNRKAERSCLIRRHDVINHCELTHQPVFFSRQRHAEPPQDQARTVVFRVLPAATTSRPHNVHNESNVMRTFQFTTIGAFCARLNGQGVMLRRIPRRDARFSFRNGHGKRSLSSKSPVPDVERL